MNSKQKLKQLNFTKCLVFILVIFCFVGIPAFILSYAVYRYNQIDESQLVLKLKSESQKLASELRQNISSEIYFCRLLHEFYIKESNNNESNYQNAINLYFDLKKNYGDYIDFIVVDNNGDVKFNSNTKKYNYTKKEWFNAYHYARRRTGYFYMLTDKNGRHLSEGELKDIRKILGPQFVEGTLGTILDHKRRSLYWCDSSKKNPPSGIYPLKWGGFFIFFSEKLLSSFMHLKNIAFDFAKNKSITTGLYKYDDINTNFESCKDILFIDEVKKALKDNQNTNKDYLETENYYISYLFLTNDIYAFVLINKKNNNNQLLYKTLFVFLLYFAISFSIIKYCWNTIVLRQPGTASIRLKLAFLFMFASGIPLLTLAIIEKEFEIYKRLTLIEEARLWSVENLLGIEQRYLSYLKNMCNILDNYVEKWSNNLKGREITINDVKEIKKLEEKYNIIDFYCIASDSQYIATLEGLFKYTGSLESIKFDESKSKKLQGLRDYRYNEIRTINIIVKKICSDLNGVELPSYILSKLELIAENVIQKSFPEIIYTIVDTLGSIKEWGFSNKSNLTYFRFISLYKKSITDYIIFLSWSPYDMQNAFLRDILNKANRNPNNFVFISYENYTNTMNPNKYSYNKDIKTFASRATEKPTEEIETIKYNNEEYIAVSFKSRNLSRYNFVGLYPMRNIDNQIKKQSFIFNLLGILCFILSIGLAHLLTKSFVAPLLNLQEGALAIENRNFKHRLTNLNIDEFGEVGGIFNHVMVGLEELEIAKIVQESMFPKPEFKQGKFSIYGKSVTMIDVGGDYLDFFKVDDSSFSVLVGDVAGHGVGAAVIMAMAKAAILGADEALRSPAMILNSLHKMILATKNAKQKKIMTFQYLHINSETGENLYGNAGACSPWLIRHSENSVTEIKMAGAALGAFKRAVYKEMPLDIKPGDAIVFYTDGIVECKDKNGEMLGYERLKKLLLKNWNSNPETYYNNIYKAYLDFVGEDSEAGDDLTFVILVYNQEV